MRHSIPGLLLSAILGFGVAQVLDTLPDDAVVSIHYMEVKGDRTEEEALRMAEEIVATLNEATPGVSWHMAQADEGDRAGQIAMVNIVESVAIRDKYWTGSEEAGEWAKLMEDPEMAAAAAMLWDSLFTSTVEGDFVIK